MSSCFIIHRSHLTNRKICLLVLYLTEVINLLAENWNLKAVYSRLGIKCNEKQLVWQYFLLRLKTQPYNIFSYWIQQNITDRLINMNWQLRLALIFPPFSSLRLCAGFVKKKTQLFTTDWLKTSLCTRHSCTVEGAIPWMYANLQPVTRKHSTSRSGVVLFPEAAGFILHVYQWKSP